MPDDAPANVLQWRNLITVRAYFLRGAFSIRRLPPCRKLPTGALMFAVSAADNEALNILTISSRLLYLLFALLG